MRVKKLYLLLCLSFLLGFTSPAVPQGPQGGQSAPGIEQQSFKVKLKGKIGRMKDFGTYYLYGAPEEYVIKNQEPKVLSRLLKSGKKVEVEGFVSRSGDLTIERIDGKPYPGKKQP